MYVHIVDLILDSTVTRNKPAKKHKLERRDSSADTCDPPSSPEKKLQKSVHIQAAAATFTTNKHPQKHPVEHRDSSADTCDPRSSPEKKMHKSAQRHAPATAPDKKLRKDQIVMQVLQHVSASY